MAVVPVLWSGSCCTGTATKYRPVPVHVTSTVDTGIENAIYSYILGQAFVAGVAHGIHNPDVCPLFLQVVDQRVVPGKSENATRVVLPRVMVSSWVWRAADDALERGLPPITAALACKCATMRSRRVAARIVLVRHGFPSGTRSSAGKGAQPHWYSLA